MYRACTTFVTEFTMHPPATNTTTAAITPTSLTATPATTPDRPNHQDEDSDVPDHPLMKVLVPTTDFYLDTYFSPVWMSGPHVFAFATDGTVVRPETYSLEPYPGYHARASRPPHLESISASHFRSFSSRDKRTWKNVAITKQDDAEFAAIQGWMGMGAGCEHQRHSSRCSTLGEAEAELVYTWPPPPHVG